MGDVGFVAALVLAATFAWAGVAKLGDRGRTERTFRAFGLAAPHVLAVAVPVIELALAVGLVVVPAAAGLVALAVLAGFTTLLLRAMRAGIAVGCGCFGTASSEPVSWVELVRNAFLGVAAVAASLGAPGVPALEAVILVTTATAATAVVLALCEATRRHGSPLRLDLGPLADPPARLGGGS